ncbi:Prolyl tripeptidyl peptidase precursor [Aquisphaera giovannonii]|uniref:Prolyl tripeptidyl peptidase n=1 Tax=Aquisphaera giovannonii TaxID=406548 RepID=A0A5B9WAF9_9BACT|nr:DPP IV N-terminal domain-containing protein [Aquisphaera giovannonii]QEH36850.1 Prolyl tripeptidyl peptidase precursor [Aquisphaera giovannonii]
MLCSFGLAALVLSILADSPPQVDSLQTVAERSGFKATARHGEVMELCRELAKRHPEAAYLTELGRSAEGRPLPLLVLADPPVKSAEEAARSGKLVVLAIGNIHAGEVCGKEALPMLAREILQTPHHPLLKNLIIALAPIYNADGNERVSRDNRPGQVGPEEGMGQRANARGLDLNRDFIKLEAPETRALVDFFNTWKPHLFIDTHTTNGSHHRYTITYEGPKNPAGDPDVIGYARNGFLPRVAGAFEGKTGLHAYYYGNFDRGRTRWTSYPAEGRYGVTYAGMRNRLSVLSEAYAYAPYKDRVLATRDFVRACLETASSSKDEIVRLIREADRKAASSSAQPVTVAIRSEPRPLAKPRPILGFEEREKDGRRVPTDVPKEYAIPLYHDFAPTESVVRPYAYILPAGQARALETLQRHGLDVQELREDVELDIEAYRVDDISRPGPNGWERLDVLELKVTPRGESRRVPAGSYLVRTRQPLGNLAVYLLEPRSEDGLATWKFFEGLKAGEDFPVLRLPQPAAMTLIAAEPPPEKRKRNQPITFDMARGSRGGGSLSGSPVTVTWLDGSHWLQFRDGKQHLVDAASGRSRPFVDEANLVKALSRLPGVDEEAARRIARGSSFDAGRNPSFDMDPARRGFLFDHNDDIYYASFDGKTAVRLTDQPGSEEYAEFSPDGRSVAFIRGFDLHVVDIENPKERALTTGGTDLVRHGIADWVYFEEIYNRRWPGFWWSPDSRRIAFMEYDDGPVGTLTMINDTFSPRKVEQNRYPRSGEPNPRVRLGVVDAAGGAVRWADLSGYSSDAFLISRVGWWADGSAAYACIQDRVQTWLDLVKIDATAASPKPTRLFRDATKAWIADPEPLAFLPDGSFLWQSERDGWKHLYRYAADGTPRGQVTSGEWEVRSLVETKPQGDWIYFTATKDTHTALNLYRKKLDGPLERITRGPGNHSVTVSPDARYFVDTWSDLETPSKVRLHAADGKLVRVVDSEPAHRLKEYRLSPRERVQVRTKDGFLLEGILVLPPDLDPGRKYPVWFMTYGGPHTPTVTDSWAGGRLWDQALASEGFIVFHLDPRSASGKGAVSAWTAYRHLGVRELEDIKEGIAWLKQRPYVDGTRIGMAGHSYGGYMTSYAMTHCDLFAAGIAGAPVTDWHDYDSIYTERFMGLPQDNPDGYDRSSVVKAARDLRGKLLIIHGVVDDNVSVRNSLRLIESLQAANRDFELMVYPGSRHGIFSPHYNRLQIEFIRRTLGGGPRPIGPESTPPPHAPTPTAGTSTAPKVGHGAER